MMDGSLRRLRLRHSNAGNADQMMSGTGNGNPPVEDTKMSTTNAVDADARGGSKAQMRE